MGSVHSSELLNLSENLICIQLKREMFSILAKINDWFQTNLVEYLRPRKIVNLCSVFSLYYKMMLHQSVVAVRFYHQPHKAELRLVIFGQIMMFIGTRLIINTAI